MKSIIWTRSIADWNTDKSLWTDSKNIIHYSCIHINWLDIKMLKLESTTNIAIITSNKTIEFFEYHFKKSTSTVDFLKKIPKIYVLSPRAKHKLKQIGVNSTCYDLINTAESLSAKIAKENAPQTINIYGAKELAFDSVGYFKKLGFKTEHIALYQTVCSQNQPLKVPDHEMILCFASPSAVKCFFQHNPTISSKNSKIIGLAIGPTTHKELQNYLDNIHVCAIPTIEELARTAMDLVI